MIGLKILLLLFVTTSAFNSAEAIIRPSASLYLMNGEGFVAYLEVPKSFGPIQNCWFKFRDDTKVKIELNATDPIITARDETVLPFATSICGIRVGKLSSASADTWTLEAENIYGDFEQDHLKIQILPAQKTNFDTRVQREMGKATIACSKHESYTKHCKIIAKTGEAWHQCELFTTIRPNVSFDCLIYNWGHLAASREHIIVDIKNSSVSTTATVQDDNTTNVVLRCQFEDALHSCQAELPDHKTELYIMDGLYNGKYSSYDTQISKSKCALELAKPLESHEIGLWRIINYGSSSGCLFYIGQSMEEIIATELQALLDVTRVLKVYQPEGTAVETINDIYCMVPFVIDDCFLSDPNNTVYFPDTIQFQRSRMYGKCAFANMPIVAGIWQCGARGHDYPKEVLQQIEVIVKPRGGEVLTELVKAKRGDTVELMCKSAFEDPLSHCVFIDPQNRVHLVGTARSIKVIGRVQYFGRGLHNGECGIRVSSVTTNDFGQWKCQFVVFAGKQNAVFNMQLTESAIAHATSVGLSVGITVIVVLVMGVVIGTIFYRRRNLSARHSFPSTDPLNEPTTIAPTNATMSTAQMEL